MQRLSLLICSFLLLSGCATTPESRISKNQSVFNTYPPEIKAKIRESKIEVGFTQEMVELALGKPDGRSTRTTTEGQHEVWSYLDSKPAISFGLGIGGGGGSTRVGSGLGIGTGGGSDEKLRVIFTAGKVSAIEKRSS